LADLSKAERAAYVARTAAAAMGTAAKHIADRSIVVSPPNTGNQVIVDPVQFKPSLRRGSTWVAVLLALLQYLPDIIDAVKTGLPPEQLAAPWASAAVIAAIAIRDAISAQGAAKVATAAVDPRGQAAAVEEGSQARLAELAMANAAKIDMLLARLGSAKPDA
jgi:hypothetical protein